METLFSIVGSVVPFIILIGIVVNVHEYGHYLAGRIFGAAIRSFSFGFPWPGSSRSIAQVTDSRGTEWKINWIPAGGYVQFVGENEFAGEETATDRRSRPTGKAYGELKAWQRMIVSLAGPAINFVFAIAVYAVMAMTLGEPQFERVSVKSVMEDSPAQQAGFQPGDIFSTISGSKIETPMDVMMAVQYSADEPVSFQVERNGDLIDLVATPSRRIFRNENLNVEEEVGFIGIEFGQTYLEHKKLGPVAAVALGVDKTINLVQVTIKVLHRLITGKDSFEKMRGPLGIGDFADKVVDSHLKKEELPLTQRLGNVSLEMISLAALFSISIGFFNLLPIPMLDGHSALLSFWETISGSAVSTKIQEYLQVGGLAAIGFFFIAVTFNDLKRTGALEVFTRLLS